MKQDNNLQSDDSETMDSDEINKDSAITDSGLKKEEFYSIAKSLGFTL